MPIAARPDAQDLASTADPPGGTVAGRRRPPARTRGSGNASKGAAPRVRRGDRAMHSRVLALLFTLASAARVVAYLPTLWAIYLSGDSSQHSLWTWLTWSAANATMAAWLYEQNGRRLDHAVLVNLCNTVMCLATTALIAHCRW